jgi:hypothetical protein
MILTTIPKTEKEKIEFRLLLSLRFACLMASRNKDPLTNCQRVIQRAKALSKHLYINHPSQLFDSEYLDCKGKLGDGFGLRVSSQNYQISIYDAVNNTTSQFPYASGGQHVA